APVVAREPVDSVSDQELAFVVGIIVDGCAPHRVSPLLDHLRELATRPDVAGMDVVLLQNGEGPGFERMVDEQRRLGTRLFHIDLAQQQADAARGIFGEAFERGSERASIARARTMLQRYLWSFAHQRKGAVVWILDDDKQLDALIDDGALL